MFDKQYFVQYQIINSSGDLIDTYSIVEIPWYSKLDVYTICDKIKAFYDNQYPHITNITKL